MQNLRYLQSILNNSGIQSSNPALFQVINEILLAQLNQQEDRDRLVADPYQFVLDPNTGLYLQNTQQSGNAEFPFRVSSNGLIYERFRTVALGDWQGYTPLFESIADPQPTNFTTSGRYTLIGSTCLFQARVALQTSFTFGSGIMGVTFPIAPNLTIPQMILSAYAQDTGTAFYKLTSQRITIQGAPHSSFERFVTATSTITTTDPFTFVDGDFLYVSGAYLIA